MELLFFFLFATVAVLAAVMVVTVRNPVHSVLALILCFFQVACLFVLLRSPFLGIAQLFIYVGAIMIFFLFAVFLLDIKRTIHQERYSRWASFALPAGIIMLVEIVLLLGRGKFGAPVQEQEAVASLLNLGKSTEAIGAVLFTKYLYPFEIISVVLLVAFVGAVVLTVKSKQED
ncbi:MAG: NADH-quinone oxidoreductase subunit J [Proteobacteria bacterium]|nr:NADH-quinone oxidoreductase subunit J [Pseudomonadota bacterium]